jgi:glycosyltransferase involved in cell wall biosynthesis
MAAAWHLLLQRARYDIVHLHGTYRRAIPIVAAARLANLTTVAKMSQMGTDDPSTTRHWRFGGLLMKALARADAVVAITDELARSYLEAGLPRDRLVRIPNGVDTSRFHPVDRAERLRLREDLALPLDGPIVLFVGIVHPRKGVDRLVAAWPRVQAQHREAALLLVGPLTSQSDGTTSRFVERLSDLEDQHRVHAVGHQDHVVRFYQAADVFVLPSRMEGLPNALLEAMACGLPVICSPLPGVAELLEHDVNGLLIAANEPIALGDAVCALLKDARRSQRLAEAGRQTVMQHYSLDAIADRYIDLYTRLAGGQGRKK